MESGPVFLGAASLAGLSAAMYASLSLCGDRRLHGVRKTLWCDGVQQVVDVDFMEVNPGMWEIASCTAFSVDDCISCDKRCITRQLLRPRGFMR